MDRIYRWIHTFFDYISSNAVFSSWGTIVKFLVVLCLLIVIILVISYAVMQATRIMVDVTQKLIPLILTVVLISLILWAILWLFHDENLSKMKAYLCKSCQISSISSPVEKNSAKNKTITKKSINKTKKDNTKTQPTSKKKKCQTVITC